MKRTTGEQGYRSARIGRKGGAILTALLAGACTLPGVGTTSEDVDPWPGETTTVEAGDELWDDDAKPGLRNGEGCGHAVVAATVEVVDKRLVHEPTGISYTEVWVDFTALGGTETGCDGPRVLVSGDETFPPPVDGPMHPQ